MEKMKSLIQHTAPTLACALKGPFAGVADKFIRDNLFNDNNSESGHSDASPHVPIEELLNDPGRLHKIQEIDQQFKLEMQKIDVDVFAIEKAGKKNNRGPAKSGYNPQVIISVLFLTAYFLMLAAIFYVEVSDKYNMVKGENSLMGELQILFGVLTAGVGQVLSYWFGGVLRKRDSSHS